MPRGVALTELLTGEEKVAPDLIGVETVSTLRRLEHQGDLDPDRAKEALDDLLDAPVQTVKTAGLLERTGVGASPQPLRVRRGVRGPR